MTLKPSSHSKAAQLRYPPVVGKRSVALESGARSLRRRRRCPLNTETLVAAKLPWKSLADAGSLLGVNNNDRVLNANQERAKFR
jgi:hypothetical protein